MSIITESYIKRVAELAKLTIKESEVHKFKEQLSKILEYVNKIGEMKTSQLPETTQVTGIKNKFREDKVDKNNILSQKEALSNASRSHKGFFVVKAIFE